MAAIIATVPGTQVSVSIERVHMYWIVKRSAAPEFGFTLERDVYFDAHEEKNARKLANALWMEIVNARNAQTDVADKTAYAKLEQAQEEKAYRAEMDTDVCGYQATHDGYGNDF